MGRKQGQRRPDWSADRVRGLRRHLGLTQTEMAGQLGIRQQTVSEWEVGAYQPRGASRTLLDLVAEKAGFRYDSGVPGAAGSSEQAGTGLKE